MPRDEKIVVSANGCLRTAMVGTFHHGIAAKYCGHGDTADRLG